MSESDTRRTCLLIEDQAVNRQWLSAALLEAFPDCVVVSCASLREARLWLSEDGQRVSVWLALIDLGLPDGSGIELIPELSRCHPDALRVVATIYDDDAHLFEALTAGAQGYLLKNQAPETLVHFLKRLEAGEPALSPAIARRLLGHFQNRRPPAANEDTDLTGRETETLTLLARGMTITEVARTLGLKGQTVAGYVKVIYQKLNVSSRAEATLKAVQRGLV